MTDDFKIYSLRDTHVGSGRDGGLDFFWSGLIDDVSVWDERRGVRPRQRPILLLHCIGHRDWGLCGCAAHEVALG